MPVKAFQVPTSTGAIPVPPRPPNDDVANKSAYINSKLTAEQKDQLISSAGQFADILEWGGYSSDFSEAAENVKHYRTANGTDRTLNVQEMSSIENDLPKFKANKNKYLNEFLDDVARQMTANKLTVGCFILEEKPGDYWLGAYATPDQSKKWFYAMGGFLFSFGARAEVLMPTPTFPHRTLKIKYKLYIYDRYNWDLGKTINITKKIDYVDYMTPGSIEPLKKTELENQPGHHYIDDNPKDPEKYVVSDSVMGSLAAAGKAQFFDIRGESPEQTINYGMPDQP